MRALSGHSSSAEMTPLRTRCFASWQARSARPTTVKAGMPLRQMRLDLDPPRLQPDEGEGDCPAEHTSDATGTPVTGVCRLCAETVQATAAGRAVRSGTCPRS